MLMGNLKIVDLSVAYPEMVIGPLTTDFSGKSVVGFLGRNGAGKTTLMKAMLGLVRKASGDVSIAGLSHSKDEKKFKQAVSYVADDTYFYSNMNLKQIANFCRSLYINWNNTEYSRLLDVFELSEVKLFKNMSKGMKTKARLILAFASQPSVILMDEPSSGLDPQSSELLIAEIKKFSVSGKAILYSSHQLEEVERICDYILIIEKGKIVKASSVDMLLSEAKEKNLNLRQYYINLTNRQV